MECLLAYCRPGFESECASELQARALDLGGSGYIRAKPQSGFIVFTPYEVEARVLARQTPFRALTFARQVVVSSGLIKDLPVTDRAGPLVSAFGELAEGFAGLWVETADTNEAKALLGFCRKFSPHLESAMAAAGLLGSAPGHQPRAHAFFLSGTAAYPGLSDPQSGSPWFMGIPRLKSPKGAPSRATMKLEEAFHLFLDKQERQQVLRPGLRAVDLGAAPGGWTWQFVRRGLRVTAVDNGAMATELMDSGLVEHLRVDGFRYAPDQPVEWMVCDMVEQPRKVASLVARWAVNGWCKRAIFNLKLPMKRRYDEVRLCREVIAERLNSAGFAHSLALKQLYHDREEVTGYLRIG